LSTFGSSLKLFPAISIREQSLAVYRLPVKISG